MTRGKLHYNADRWWAYCADRMGWQVGQWIDKFTDGSRLPANPRCPVGDARLPGNTNAATVSPRIGRTVSEPSTFNGNAADAGVCGPEMARAGNHPEAPDAAAPTYSVFRTRHQRGGETVDE